MARTLLDDLTWIGPCEPVGDAHMHISVFLLESTEGFVLIDTGSVVDTETIEAELAAVLDGAPVEVIVITHTDLPHIGNLRHFQERWPDAEVITGAGIPEIVGLPTGTRQSVIGDRERIAGRTLEFIDPPLADRSNTTWIFDEDASVLFTSDGLGYYHEPGVCEATSSEHAPTAAGITAYHQTALPWLQYADPALVMAALDALLERYDPAMVLPSHGGPIAREDLDDYLRLFESAITQIRSSHASAP